MIKNLKSFIPFTFLILLCFCLWKGLVLQPFKYNESKNSSLNTEITSNNTNNNITLYPFKKNEQEKMFKELISELRCIICQNQNLTESQSDTAIRIKNQIYNDITLGKNREDILNNIVNHYGEFILYRPPFHAGTSLLWLGPIFLFLLGLFCFWKIMK